MLVIGGIWKWYFPLNKNIWTSSYVMVMAGMSTLTLGAFMYIIDLKGHTRWTALGRVFGANSIAAYVMAGMLTTIFYSDLITGVALNNLWMDSVTAIGVAPKLASLLYALFYVGVIFVPTYILYKKKIFIKV